jgi:dTMP kinase
LSVGKLIAVEGIDGAGKTTQAALLAASLAAQGWDVVSTREPTGGRWGQLIRSTSSRGEEVRPSQELEWFMSDRAEHVANLIEPALEAGKVVVTDRYFLSTVAYQGARGLPFDELLQRSEGLFPVPALAIVIEVPPKLGLERVHQRGTGLNPVFERLSFLEQVAVVFRKLDRPYIMRIDGRAEIDRVRETIAREIRDRLDMP